jgi:sulfur carrier protein
MSDAPSAGAAAALSIHVNDEPRTLGASATLGVLVAELGLGGRKGVALAVNGSVVPRAAWPDHALAHGDRVLVIRATQGG